MLFASNNYSYVSLTLTRAAKTFKLIKRRFTNCRVSLVVVINGNMYDAICELINSDLVWELAATHSSKAKTVHTRNDWWGVRVAGFIINGLICSISCSSAATVPTECHSNTAKSGTSVFLLLKSIPK